MTAPRGSRVARAALLLLMAAVLVLVVVRWPDLEAWLRAAGPGGAGAFVGLFVVMTGVCFPVSVLGFTAGYVYGPLAYALMPVAVHLAGALMFLLGRTALRGAVARWAGRDPRLSTLEELAAQRAVRLNLLARLSPFNFGVVCYTLAAGRSGWKPYLLGLFGTWPSLALQVTAGWLARRGVTGGAPSGWRLGATAVAVVALLALGWQVARLARRAWHEAAEGKGDEPPR